MMMGDGKMGSILPFLLMSSQGPGQSNMMPIMMMMMMDEDQNLGDILPMLLMMQNPGHDHAPHDDDDEQGQEGLIRPELCDETDKPEF